jgi:hypothetical protein
MSYTFLPVFLRCSSVFRAALCSVFWNTSEHRAGEAVFLPNSLFSI